MKNEQIQGFYEFTGFRLDIKKNRLMRGDDMVPLTPKEFDLLFLLMKNAGRVVEKDELLTTVWKDTFVEEGTLTRNISWLRKKLAAYDGAKIIETLPKRGYRFLPEIRQCADSLIIEEQTVQQIEIEEIIEFEPSSGETTIIHENIFAGEPKPIYNHDRRALPAAASRPVFSKHLIYPILLTLLVAAFIVYYGYFAAKPANVILAAKIAPFSGLPGRESSPAFSPDGKQMVFAWDGGIEEGNFDIYVKLVGTGEPVQLTKTETEEINPVFSPDGKSIAFIRHFPAHNEIILMPALGGAERVISDKASYASLSFSPDGKFLAHANLDLSASEAGIFTINVETGEKTRITTPVAPAVDHTPRFSPDGNSLAFIRYFSSFRREIFVVNALGGEPRQITSDDVRIYGLAWNADSRSLFFTSFRATGQLNLWQTVLDESEPRLIPTGGKGLQSIAISPNGRMIAFVEETEDENIWQVEPDGKKSLLIRSTRADHSQQVSPDGTKIVFASERTGNYQIWLSDADGKNQRQLTDFANNSAGSPRFSPDGKSIAFDAQIAGGSDVYIVPINGGAPRRLTEGGKNNSLPAWSADGEWIFFISNRTGSDQIWKMPVNGGEAVQITKQGAFEIFAAPDGKQIIYSKAVGKVGLWNVGVDGGDEKPIPELAGAGNWRSWCVAANGIYYTAFSIQPPFRIQFFDFATRRTKEITAVDKAPPLYYSNLAVSPDEKKVLYARRDQSASAIMLAYLD